jgi:hypothetical protein
MTDCIHRWRIDTPDGRSLVRGVCRVCSADRLFLASSEWDRADRCPKCRGAITPHHTCREAKRA